jgi:hypothetical protein
MKSFRDVSNHIHGLGLAAPSASHRVDQRVAGNPNVFKEAAEPQRQQTSASAAAGPKRASISQLSGSPCMA